MLRHVARFWTIEEMTAEEIMAESREVDRQDARASGSRLGRGNIPFQLDSVVTPDDLKNERRELATFSFPPLA